MLVLQETTPSFPLSQLHMYFVTDDKFKAIGYIKRGQSNIEIFTVPLQFNAKGRTFKTLKKIPD